MFVRNRLNSGEYITVIPQGLPVTLQYDENGRIEKTYIGYETTSDHLSDALFDMLLKRNAVPRTIPLLDGTTWIFGVLYTGEPVTTTGNLPSDQATSYLNMYLKFDNIEFNFFAATMRTFAGKFQGAIQIIQWLALAKFARLPGVTITEDTYDMDTHIWETLDTFPFRYPLISGYFVNRNGNIRYESTGLFQCTVESITPNVDAVGRISNLISTSNGTLRYVSCQECIQFDIQAGRTIVFSADNTVVYAYPDDKLIPDSHKYYCSLCGRAVTVPDSGVVMCPDEHCTSRLYPRVEQLLRTLGLPVLSYATYREVSSPTRGAFALADILDADAISKSCIECSLSTILRAAVPINIVPATSNLLDDICRGCNNSLHTLNYYLQNPRAIATDLDIHDSKKFATWLEDSVNVSDIISIISHPNIKINLRDCKFDGPPIFRNKLIYITGKFLHGSNSEISAILASYGARTVTEFTLDVDCVLVGDTQEDVAGYAIQSALKSRIPVFVESEFFCKYDIDNDLLQNL